jgi:hypothetical protein
MLQPQQLQKQLQKQLEQGIADQLNEEGRENLYSVRHIEVLGTPLIEPYIGASYPIFGPVGHFSFEHVRGPLIKDPEILLRKVFDLNQNLEVGISKLQLAQEKLVQNFLKNNYDAAKLKETIIIANAGASSSSSSSSGHYGGNNNPMEKADNYNGANNNNNNNNTRWNDSSTHAAQDGKDGTNNIDNINSIYSSGQPDNNGQSEKTVDDIMKDYDRLMQGLSKKILESGMD